MSLVARILHLRPDLDPVMDFAVQQLADDSERIVHWSNPTAQPSQTELESAYPDALREQKRAEIRAGLIRDCEAIMPVYELVYCLRARVQDSRLATLDSLAKRARDLEAYIDEKNPRGDYLRTVAEIEAIAW